MRRRVRRMSFISWRLKWKHLLILTFFILFLNYMGVFTHFFEESYELSFQYPMKGDVDAYVQQLRRGETPSVHPINVYNYKFLTRIKQKCQNTNVRLLFIVKSAASHFERRQAIRSSWGYEKRFSDVTIRCVFVVGVVDDTDILLSLIHEREIYQDIVHVDFYDSYYNNTIKTMTGMKWAVQYCSEASYYFFSDDDMYVSAKNILRFVRNPLGYPHSLEESHDSSKWLYAAELPKNVTLYAGYVFNSSPLRHKPSKWYVSLEEYPYDMWPPYVTAGGYILSREALHRMYYTSLYTQHFRFDDIFLGLVAKKAGIEPFHCEHFHFYQKEYSLLAYQYAISVHGYSMPHSMVKIWSEQKSAGNA